MESGALSALHERPHTPRHGIVSRLFPSNCFSRFSIVCEDSDAAKLGWLAKDSQNHRAGQNFFPALFRDFYRNTRIQIPAAKKPRDHLAPAQIISSRKSRPDSLKTLKIEWAPSNARRSQLNSVVELQTPQRGETKNPPAKCRSA
jgi:hypothetical protein